MGDERDWSSEVDALVELLTEHYLFPDVAERTGELLHRRLAEGGYRDVADDESFAAAVTEDTVAASGDLHLRLRYSVAALGELADLVVPNSGRDPTEAASVGHGFAKVERLPGNVGLIDVRRFLPVSMSGPQGTAAMNLVAATDVLLIDLRRSIGGEPDMVTLLCSYLFDEKVHLDNLYFPASDTTLELWTEWPVPGPSFGGSKPIYVLTSRETISAAEGFGYDLQQLERAVLVGETTAGAGNFDYRYRVSDHLMFSVPSGYPVNPVSGKGWEGVGVAPDIEVRAEEAFIAAYKLALAYVMTLDSEGHHRAVFEETGEALAAL